MVNGLVITAAHTSLSIQLVLESVLKLLNLWSVSGWVVGVAFNPASSGICFETINEKSLIFYNLIILSIQLVLESVLKLLLDIEPVVASLVLSIQLVLESVLKHLMSVDELKRTKYAFNPASSGICFETWIL